MNVNLLSLLGVRLIGDKFYRVVLIYKSINSSSMTQLNYMGDSFFKLR